MTDLTASHASVLPVVQRLIASSNTAARHVMSALPFFSRLKTYFFSRCFPLLSEKLSRSACMVWRLVGLIVLFTRDAPIIGRYRTIIGRFADNRNRPITMPVSADYYDIIGYWNYIFF